MESYESVFSVGLNHYLLLSLMMFFIGLAGILVRKNIIVVLMCIELMLNGVNLSFLAFSHFYGHLNGQVMVFFVMTIAAAEAGVGLALAVNIFKRFKEVDMNFFRSLKD